MFNMFTTTLYRTSLVLLALCATINTAPINPSPPTYVLQNADLNSTLVSTKVNERDATGLAVSAYLCTDSHWQGYCEDIRTQAGVCCQSPPLSVQLNSQNIQNGERKEKPTKTSEPTQIPSRPTSPAKSAVWARMRIRRNAPCFCE